jgi:quinoprotein glucose dehydrogenase
MFDQLVCRVMFHQLRYEGIFTPPSEQGTLVFPGNLGMFEWGGISVDPNRQVAIANPMALPFVSKLIPRGPGNPMEPPKDAKGTGTESGIQPQYGVPFGVTLNPFLSPFGLPCKQPAWGYISGLDLKTNQIVGKNVLVRHRTACRSRCRFRCRSIWVCQCWVAQSLPPVTCCSSRQPQITTCARTT